MRRTLILGFRSAHHGVVFWEAGTLSNSCVRQHDLWINSIWISRRSGGWSETTSRLLFLVVVVVGTTTTMYDAAKRRQQQNHTMRYDGKNNMMMI